MSTQKVVSLKAVRDIKVASEVEQEYQAKILVMDKLELLEEMVRFQEERSGLGTLTPSLMLRGRILFKALEQSAETQELKLLTRSYRRHIEYEIAEYMKNPEASRSDSEFESE